jgi:hypothetical protein
MMYFSDASRLCLHSCQMIRLTVIRHCVQPERVRSGIRFGPAWKAISDEALQLVDWTH